MSDELYNNALSLLYRKNIEVRNLVMGNRGMRWGGGGVLGVVTYYRKHDVHIVVISVVITVNYYE